MSDDAPASLGSTADKLQHETPPTIFSGTAVEGCVSCAVHNVLIATNWLHLVGNDRVIVFVCACVGFVFLDLILTYLACTILVLSIDVQTIFLYFGSKGNFC